MNRALKRYKYWKKKHRHSITIYVIINVWIFIMLASTTILNLYALKYGTGDNLVKAMFITMAILAAFGSFVNSVISFFNYKRRTQAAQEKIQLVNNHIEWFKNNKKDVYDGERKNINLLENITEILNKD